MKPTLKRPTIDSVTTINTDGSHYILHPADVQGRFTVSRRLFALCLIAVYILLPWIPINGNPAVFLDVENRRFHLFGLTFLAQDLWLAFFVVSGVGFALFYLTALFGRLWCGWACPYTVFLEHVVRRLERWIEGDAASRRRIDIAPWNSAKILRRGLKLLTFFLASFVIAHFFLAYFVSLPKLWKMMMHNPQEHWLAFSVVMFLTVVLFFCFAWFREQFCIVLCPYGRIQSALTDDHTLTVGYDKGRGEPRGKAGSPGAGDCINCQRCVQVCPTGIDIRNGLQLECIGCSACIDACNEIMTKLDRPTGLVRYDSMQGLQGKKTRWIRPRIVAYTVLMAVGVLALGLTMRRLHGFQATLTRMTGAPYYVGEAGVRNQFQLRIINKQQTEQEYRITLEKAPEGTLLGGLSGSLKVAPQSEQQQVVMIEIPRAVYAGKQSMQISVINEAMQDTQVIEFEFTGPNPRLLTEDINKKTP